MMSKAASPFRSRISLVLVSILLPDRSAASRLMRSGVSQRSTTVIDEAAALSSNASMTMSCIAWSAAPQISTRGAVKPAAQSGSADLKNAPSPCAPETVPASRRSGQAAWYQSQPVPRPAAAAQHVADHSTASRETSRSRGSAVPLTAVQACGSLAPGNVRKARSCRGMSRCVRGCRLSRQRSPTRRGMRNVPGCHDRRRWSISTPRSSR